MPAPGFSAEYPARRSGAAVRTVSGDVAGGLG
ncbi:hypothetical protein EMIT0P294_70095 [Pseudomonas sp. IT-P294]